PRSPRISAAHSHRSLCRHCSHAAPASALAAPRNPHSLAAPQRRSHRSPYTDTASTTTVEDPSPSDSELLFVPDQRFLYQIPFAQL
ncbi:hypothetical protein S245_027532, partial [Arachis hypogaea]